MELPIFTHEGKDTGRKAQLPASLYEALETPHNVYMAIKHYLAAQRQGTHKTQEKSEVTASTRKIQRQKGSGNARQGSVKSNLHRGGGRTFGPRPRDYSFKLNKKQKRLARSAALRHRAQHQQLLLVEDFTLPSPRTQAYHTILRNLQVQDKKTLFILPDYDRHLLLASRNLPHSQVTTVSQLHTYQVLHAHQLVLLERALPLLAQHLA